MNDSQPTDVVSSEEKEEDNLKEIDQKKKRYLSIDLFRGLAIVGMVFVNIIAEFDNTLDWSKHTRVMKLGQTCQRWSNRRLSGSPHVR